MKFKTIEEFTKAGGNASAKKRFEGLTREQISEYMRLVRKRRTPKIIRPIDTRFNEDRYPKGIE